MYLLQLSQLTAFWLPENVFIIAIKNICTAGLKYEKSAENNTNVRANQAVVRKPSKSAHGTQDVIDDCPVNLSGSCRNFKLPLVNFARTKGGVR